MTRRTVITCDNCMNEEPLHDHARRVTVTVTLNHRHDEGMKDLGLPQSFDLCGRCAAHMRDGLKGARP